VKAGRVRDWLVFSDVHILVVAAGWMLGNSALLAYELPVSFLVLASVGAFLVYRVDRFLVESPEDAVNAPGRVDFSIQYRKGLVLLAAAMTLLAVLLALTMDVLWLELACLVGALGLIYPLRILPGGARPKDVTWLKTTLIAACWVGGGVVLPFFLFGNPEGLSDASYSQGPGSIIPLSIYRVAYILPNLLTADWLDRKGDEASNVGNLVRGWSPRQLRRTLAGTALVGLIAAMYFALSGWSILLVAVDLVGLMGLAFISDRMVGINGGDSGLLPSNKSGMMTVLDLWVAWPLVVWILWVAVS
jgi:hypothetical protein